MAANGTPSRSGIAGTKRKRFPHGNYTGYYATRYGLSDRTEASGLRDPRLDLLRTEWFEGKRCLDVGCNEGDLTLALVLRFRPCRMVGLDIDGKLVDRARKALETHIRIASTEVQRKERVHDETRERDACAERDTNSLARPAGTSSTTQPCAVPPGAHASGSETDAGSSLKESTRYKRGTSCLQPDPNLDHGRSGPLDVGSLPLADCNVACSEKAPRNGEDVSSDRSGAASDGKAVTCNGEAVVCNGEAVVCNGEAVVCNGEKVEGDGRAAPCSGKGVARDGRRAFKGEGDASNGEGEFARGGREDVPSGDDPGKQAAALVTENAKGESAKAPDWDRERSEPSLDYDGRRTRNDRRSSSGPEAQARATSRSGAMMLAGCVVSFQREDFATEMHNDHGYDVVSLFSVVKWIHLNGGDDAIRRVFRKACALLKPGGRLIMEPQPWKSYSKSARQHGTPRARAQVSAIKIRPSDFPSLLTGEIGFRSWEKVGSPGKGIGSFAERCLHVFVK